MNADELAYLHGVYQNQHMLVSNSISMGLEELRGLNAAARAIGEIGSISDRGLLQDLGGGFYIRATAGKADSVMVGIGGGYIIEKSVGDAKTAAEERIKSRSEVLDRLVKSRRELEAAMMEIEERMQGEGDVRQP